ncbi:MAG: A/G-specific adenine glycosylase [Lautropia sp.]
MPPEPASCRGLAASVVTWHRLHGRHDLPWQRSRDPYRVWLSEIMLQQTQVATAVPYYLRFLERFPDVHALAAADVDAVLGAWSGLGYYSRARNLHRAAAIVAAQGWPDDVAGLKALPGVGRSTAAAIASFCFGRRAPILDGNVKRVFSRVFGVAATDARGVERLWSLAQCCIDDPSLGLADVPAYVQGLMDLGATVCARAKPACTRCPLSGRCTAFATDATARFPAARAPRAAPIRAYSLLLLRRGAQVLLERRAPRGLWGGLWSLPVLCVDGDRPLEDAWRETLRRLAPATVDPAGRTGPAGPADPTVPALPAAPVARFEHAFTHFRMRAEVWACVLPAAPAPGRVDPVPVTPDPALVALDPRDAHALADAPLPKPVRSLLAVLGGG